MKAFTVVLIQLGGQLCSGTLYEVMCVSGLIYFRRRAENDGSVHGAAKPQRHVLDVRSFRAEQARSIVIVVTTHMSLSLCLSYRHSPSMMYESYYGTDV
jgi:hypothetical protein